MAKKYAKEFVICTKSRGTEGELVYPSYNGYDYIFCPLGFYLMQSGFKLDELENHVLPSEIGCQKFTILVKEDVAKNILGRRLFKEIECSGGFYGGAASLEYLIGHLNDMTQTLTKARKDILKKLFALAEVKVKFVNRKAKCKFVCEF